MMSGITVLSLFFHLILLLTVIIGISGNVFLRFHEEAEARNLIPIPTKANSMTANSSDSIAVENYLRNYRHGPHNDRYMLYNHDVIATYVGPYPKEHPIYPTGTKGTIRAWAMFDSRTDRYCHLIGVHDWGQLALFNCPDEGLYHAYAIETVIDDGFPIPTVLKKEDSDRKYVLGWFAGSQREQFDLLSGQDLVVSVFNLPQSQEKIKTTEERMNALLQWSLGEDYEHLDQAGTPFKLQRPPQITMSDPVAIKESNYCYFWTYTIAEKAKVGYVSSSREIQPTYRDSQTKRQSSTAYLLLELLIWIAEPSAIDFKETLERPEQVFVSEYSRVITKRYSEIGLFPCLRKAHSSIEVVEDILYIPDHVSSTLSDTPHWRATIKIHTDRLISTLSDITFTIASRQNTASFHCFVGDTRVFFKLRDFEFVKMGRLQPEDINMNASTFGDSFHLPYNIKFQKATIYGKGVHHIGNKWSKKYQPASVRSDMTIIPNPCIVQEFAFSVGGSLYIATNLLRKGAAHAKRVVLPDFRKIGGEEGIKRPFERSFLRVFDVTFTPTHVIFLMADAHVMLHSSSAKIKGLAHISETQKFRPDAFVKRKWCPRTASPKLSASIVPMYGVSGDIIIFQVYPTEGNVPMWVIPPSPSCLPEQAGFVKKTEELAQVINETDIHYNEFAAVKRTNQKTGLSEPSIPRRPPPPSPPDRNIYEQNEFILDSSRQFVVEGEDPHFPLELIDPASHILETNLKDYNRAKIYVVAKQSDDQDRWLERMLTGNGLSTSDPRIADMEFTAAEKQFIFASSFNSLEILDLFAKKQRQPFQVIISTITVTNFPYRVKLEPIIRTTNGEYYEKLDTVIPFPGTVLVRESHYHVEVVKSRDVKENAEHAKELQGSTDIPFVPDIHVLGTAIPSYIVNLGNVLVHSCIDNRYARPLHYYSWDVLNDAQMEARASQKFNPRVVFNQSSLKFAQNNSLYDTVVTEQGLISVLRRKSKRHLVQDDEDCLYTPDSDYQRVIMGTVSTLEGLREVQPFFRNDNIFQLGTPDNEIIYGTYDVKPRSSFKSCPPDDSGEDTSQYYEACIEQPTATLSNRLVPVCTSEFEGLDRPCSDPGFLRTCDDYSSSTPRPNTTACIRRNLECPKENNETETGHHEDDNLYVIPKVINDDKCDKYLKDKSQVTLCLPTHAPREDIRSVNILGTSYQSYWQGSLESVRTLHPEANTVDDESIEAEITEEPDMCPFVLFEVFHKEIDFAEVGYQSRVTAQVSYIGTGIPVEADIVVEYERTMGVVIEITTSVNEIRQLTKIVKAVDVHFHMPDYKLDQLMATDPSEKHHQRINKVDYEDIRAREKFSVFSITFRPSIVNSRCKSNELFKTIQFNVGCNAFSSIRLMSEATALKVINWTETLDEQTGFQWHRDYNNWNLTVPKVHIYYKQLKRKVFNCDRKICQIPFFHLFKDDIYTLSYRDVFKPKFEQFLTVSSRPVSGNVVLYDMLGSKDFTWTLTEYNAGCKNTAHFWYDDLLAGTRQINYETFEHENVYLYYRDCFDLKESIGNKGSHKDMLTEGFYFFNQSDQTNNNSLRFDRHRNEIFIFRAVVMNTFHNRFTYCKQLDTFFMVRIVGIPIPRQGLELWQYALTVVVVALGFVVWYFVFARFYTWTVRN